MPDLPESGFAVVYDANVLYPAPLRDLLMHLALAGLYRARWTDRIHDEWICNLLANRPELSRDRLERTRRLMNTNVRDALVTGYEPLIDGLDLPDADDRHVLAAALQAGAEVIVTANLKDFPPSILDPLGVAAWHPNHFVCDLLDRSPASVVRAVRDQRRSLRNPPASALELLDTLASQQLPRASARLREAVDALE